MKRPRWVVYWSVQDPVAMPPWPLCAGHRETTRRPLPACAGTLVCGTPINLNVERVADGICALAAFGLLISVALQAMLHAQVATGLAPPKGMNLPLVSDGGSSLLATCLAVGLALGAAQPQESDQDDPLTSA